MHVTIPSGFAKKIHGAGFFANASCVSGTFSPGDEVEIIRVSVVHFPHVFGRESLRQNHSYKNKTNNLKNKTSKGKPSHENPSLCQETTGSCDLWMTCG
jgi:hypothetical protein